MSTSWKQWLTDAETHSRGVGKSAYHTAIAVRNLWRSREFLKDACGGVLDDLSSKLSKYSGRFALGLNDLIQMVEHFPSEKDWSEGRLDLIREETCRIVLSKSKRRLATDNNGKRHVISQAKYKALEKKYRALQARYRKLESEYNKLIGTRRIAKTA